MTRANASLPLALLSLLALCSMPSCGGETNQGGSGGSTGTGGTGMSGGNGGASECGLIECFRNVECVAECGGPVLRSSCCPCAAGTFDRIQCSGSGGSGGGG